MEVLSIRRADGRELSLEDLSVAQALGNGETVRAEEIVLRVPDGRSVTILMNATPIRSEQGELESLIVTMQDMTPLEDLERLRAEFLGTGEPRAAHPTDIHQGLGCYIAGISVHPGFSRNSAARPHHRGQANRIARPDQRSSGRSAHRDGRTLSGNRTDGSGGPCGRGEEHVPECRRQGQYPHGIAT